MRPTIYLSAFLCASSAAASGIDAFKRVDRVLESRAAAHHNAPDPSHEQLQKRASRYLNNVTESESKQCDSEVHADSAPEYVVDGTKIPDVDVCSGRSTFALETHN